MNISFELDAEPRADVGKGASRRLRRQNRVPGIIYGADIDPVQISVAHNVLLQHLENEAFYTHILTVKVDGKAETVVLKDLQRHPAKPIVMHVDFQRVSDDRPLVKRIPLHFVNQSRAPGVKLGGEVSHNLGYVEVSCLPKDLPEYIEVDMSEMEAPSALHMSDLKLPEGVTIPVLTLGADHDMAVVQVHKVMVKAE